MADLPVSTDANDARRTLELAHETLSTGSVIVYNPDWGHVEDGVPTEWIKSDVHRDARRAR